MDSSSFCTALGPKEANKQLRRHWKTWVTEDIIRDLSSLGPYISLFYTYYPSRSRDTKNPSR